MNGVVSANSTKIYPQGPTESLPVAMPGPCFGFAVSLDVSQHIDPAVTVKIDLYASPDNGNTWDYAGGMTRNGAPGDTLATLESTIARGDGVVNNLPGWTNPLFKSVITVLGGSCMLGTLACVGAGAAPDLTHHSIAAVQSVSAKQSAGSSITTAGITTTTGNMVHADTGIVLRTFTSITDSLTNTWALGNAELLANNTRVRQNYVPSSTFTGGAGHTFTLTINTNGPCAIAVTEISGAVTTSPVDASGQTSDTLQTSHPVSTSGATIQNDEIACACLFAANAVQTFAKDAAYTEQQNSADAVGSVGYITETLVLTATGVQTCTATSNVNASAVMMIITYKAAAAISTPDRLMMLGVS